MKPYPVAEELLEPVRQVAMPRALRLVAPGGTVHVVARYNNREFYVATPGVLAGQRSVPWGAPRS